MIEAVDHPIWSPVVIAYSVATIRSHFHSLRLRLEDPDPSPLPTLIQATHVSWWDGHLGFVMSRALGMGFRVMMLESELQKYAFLRYAGTFGFTPGSIASVRETIRYAVRELEPARRARSKMVLMFPSGEIVPASRRPIPMQAGVSSMALQAVRMFGSVRVRSMALRLEHRGQARPEAFVRLGAARIITAGTLRSLTDSFGQDLTLEADALERDLRDDRLGDYREILRGFPSAQEGWDAVRRHLGMRI
jgi:hypothetical protein